MVNEYLTLVDFFLQRPLRQEPVNKNWLLLAETVRTENCLNVVRRVPARVKYHHSVRCNQVDPQTSSPRMQKHTLLKGRKKLGKLIKHLELNSGLTLLRSTPL